jgi:hypothetical protein
LTPYGGFLVNGTSVVARSPTVSEDVVERLKALCESTPKEAAEAAKLVAWLVLQRPHQRVVGCTFWCDIRARRTKDALFISVLHFVDHSLEVLRTSLMPLEVMVGYSDANGYLFEPRGTTVVGICVGHLPATFWVVRETSALSIERHMAEASVMRIPDASAIENDLKAAGVLSS